MNNPIIKKDRQYVILDTCIIQHFGNKELADCILSDLKEAVTAGYGLAISDFSFFELLNGATLEREQQRIEALAGLSRYFVKKDILIIAAHLGCLYKEDNADAEIGDKIIGATSFLFNSVIYTTNGRDFPRPFFNEIAKRYLKYSKNGAEIILPSYFLIPDKNFIVTKYNERMKPLETKMLSGQTPLNKEETSNI